jgi:hypothetical protein
MSRLLGRYLLDFPFASADELSEWFAQNRSRLFFSDTGGFRWLLNPKAPAATPSGTR